MDPKTILDVQINKNPIGSTNIKKAQIPNRIGISVTNIISADKYVPNNLVSFVKLFTTSEECLLRCSNILLNNITLYSFTEIF